MFGTVVLWSVLGWAAAMLKTVKARNGSGEDGLHLLSSQQLALHQCQLCTAQWGSRDSQTHPEAVVMYTGAVRKCQLSPLEEQTRSTGVHYIIMSCLRG